MAESGRQLGLEIVQGDVIEYLRQLPDASLQAVTGFHLIEHFEFQDLLQLLLEIRRVLAWRSGNGGNPNPKNLVVGACNFYADHHRQFFRKRSSFFDPSICMQTASLICTQPTVVPSTIANRLSRTSYVRLFGPRDFAAIGWKS